MEIVVRGKNRPVPVRLREISREKVARIARFDHDVGRVEVDRNGKAVPQLVQFS
jgi:ribosome-associated translation inhibitor RaiA